MIGTKQTNATRWSQEIGRQDITVQQWVRRYNESGLAGIIYEHTGGPVPFLPKKSANELQKR
jgi:transposase